MRTNGYKVIDFKGANIGEGEVPGIFNKIETAKKPLVFANYTVGESDDIQAPFFAGIGVKSTYAPRAYQYTYFLTADSNGGITLLTIKDDDTVAIESV